MQIVFHTTISEEENSFSYEDVVSDVCKKLIIRHPHVFGNVEANTSEKVLENWDKIKANTKNQNNLSDKLESIAKTLPSLTKMQKAIHKANKYNIKPNERLLEDDNEELIAKKLVSVLNECEKNNVDAESALRHYYEKFLEQVKSEN